MVDRFVLIIAPRHVFSCENPRGHNHHPIFQPPSKFPTCPPSHRRPVVTRPWFLPRCEKTSGGIWFRIFGLLSLFGSGVIIADCWIIETRAVHARSTAEYNAVIREPEGWRRARIGGRWSDEEGVEGSCVGGMKDGHSAYQGLSPAGLSQVLIPLLFRVPGRWCVLILSLRDLFSLPRRTAVSSATGSAPTGSWPRQVVRRVTSTIDQISLPFVLAGVRFASMRK